MKSYLKSLLALAAAGATTLGIMWLLTALLKFDLGAFLNGLN